LPPVLLLMTVLPLVVMNSEPSTLFAVIILSPLTRLLPTNWTYSYTPSNPKV
jgi:hypothetical protein